MYVSHVWCVSRLQNLRAQLVFSQKHKDPETRDFQNLKLISRGSYGRVYLVNKIAVSICVAWSLTLSSVLSRLWLGVLVASCICVVCSFRFEFFFCSQVLLAVMARVCMYVCVCVCVYVFVSQFCVAMTDWGSVRDESVGQELYESV
jgi:hypothetical protein